MKNNFSQKLLTVSIMIMMLTTTIQAETRIKFGGPGTPPPPPTEETVEAENPPKDMGAVNGPRGTEWFSTGGEYSKGVDGMDPDEEYQEARYAATGEMVDPSTIPSIPQGGDPTSQRDEANRQIGRQTGWDNPSYTTR